MLKQCGDEMTRANLMKQLAAMDMEIGIYLPGIRIKTSPTDFAPMEQLRLHEVQGRRLGAVRPVDGRRRELIRNIRLHNAIGAVPNGPRRLHFAARTSHAASRSARKRL